MKVKKIIGIVLIIIGIIAFLYALNAKGRVKEARENVEKTSGMFSDGPVNQQITGAIEKKIGSYDAPIMYLTIGGVALFVIGAGMLICCRKKR